MITSLGINIEEYRRENPGAVLVSYYNSRLDNTEVYDKAVPGKRPGATSPQRYLRLGIVEGRAATETQHVVTPVEEMLRQARPAGKASDPRETVEKAPREAVAGYAYLMADEHDRVKIGAATDVLQRRADLQVGNADDLTILDVIVSDDMYALEAALKAHYRHARVRGEWFSREAVEGVFGTEGL